MKEPETKPEIKLNGWCSIPALARKIGKAPAYVRLQVHYEKVPVIRVAELLNMPLVPEDAIKKTKHGFEFKYYEAKEKKK